MGAVRARIVLDSREWAFVKIDDVHIPELDGAPVEQILAFLVSRASENGRIHLETVLADGTVLQDFVRADGTIVTATPNPGRREAAPTVAALPALPPPPVIAPKPRRSVFRGARGERGRKAVVEAFTDTIPVATLNIERVEIPAAPVPVVQVTAAPFSQEMPGAPAAPVWAPVAEDVLVGLPAPLPMIPTEPVPAMVTGYEQPAGTIPAAREVSSWREPLEDEEEIDLEVEMQKIAAAKGDSRKSLLVKIAIGVAALMVVGVALFFILGNKADATALASVRGAIMSFASIGLITIT